MKTKFLLLIFTLFIVNQVFSQFTLSAELRPRTEYRNGFKTLISDAQDAAFFTSQRTRLNTKFAKENYTLFISFQDIRVWGDVSQLNVSDKNGLALHEAWGLVNFSNLSVKAGRQEIVYDDQRMFGNVGWAQQGRSHDALLLKFNSNNLKLDLGFAFNQENEALFNTTYLLNGNYKALQYVWLNNKWTKVQASFLILNNGLQYVDSANNNNNEVRYSQTFGTHLKINLSPKFNSNINLFYQTGNDISNRDISAYLIGADFSYKASENVNLGFGLELQSGNDYNENPSKNKAFNPFYGTNHKFNGFMDYFYVGNHINSVGLTDIYASANFKLNPKSNLSIYAHNFSANANLTAYANKQFGTEIDLVYAYKMNADVSISGGYSQMFAAEGMEILKQNFDGNSNNWAWLMLTINPTIFSN